MVSQRGCSIGSPYALIQRLRISGVSTLRMACHGKQKEEIYADLPPLADASGNEPRRLEEVIAGRSADLPTMHRVDLKDRR